MRRHFPSRLAESFFLRPARVLTILLSAIAALAALNLTAGTARALEAIWQGTFSEFWTNDFNWFGASPPVPADKASFDESAVVAVPRPAIILDADRTVLEFVVRGNHAIAGAYSFTSFNNAVLTVTEQTTFGLSGSSTSTTTLDGFRLNTDRLFVQGPMTVDMTGGAVVTTTSDLEMFDTSVLNLNSGSLNLAANTAHFLSESSTLNVNGGTLNLGPDASLNVNDSAKLNFASGYNVTNNTILRAQGGGDIVGTFFIDVGHGGIGSLAVNGPGSSIVSQSSTSDWGRGAGSQAIVDIFSGGTAEVATLRVGTNNAQALLNVNGGTLIVNDTLEVGGGLTIRSLQMTVQNSGTMTVNGAATFNNHADLNLVSGTLDFNRSATFNAGSRLDITGGTLDITNQTLTVNGGTLTRSTSGALNSGSALIVQGGGTATFSGFFDIGNGNDAALTVTGNGSTYSAGGLSDWGRGASGGAVVSVDSNAIATLSSLRIGTDNGSANVTVASGGQLRPAGLTVGGGSNNRTVNLTINGGTLAVTDPNSITTFNDKAVLNLQSGTFDPKGNVTFFTGATANWSGGTFLTPSGKFLTVSGGTINRTITAATGISTGSTLAIDSAGTYASVGSYSVGEFGGGTVTVDGANSVFRTSTDFNLGGSSVGQVGTVTTTNGGRLHIGDAANQSGVFAANDMFVSDLNNPASNQGGFLRVSNGSTLTHAGNMLVANQANEFGQVRVDGANSQLIPTGLTVIGRFGSATLDVQNGGAVRTDIYVQSFDAGSNSTTNVTGASSLLDVTGNLVVGRAGEALMDITAGGRVEAGGVALLGEVAGGNGTIRVFDAGSTFEADNEIQVGLGGFGTLGVYSGGNVTTPIVTVGGGGVLDVLGASVTGDVTLLSNSDMYANDATVGPLTQQAGAGLHFQLRGTSDFDNLHVLGPAILHGDLDVTLGSGYTPQSGDSFEFLTSAAEISENFGSLNFPTLSGGLDWQLDFSPQALTLTVIGGLPGDFDLDGDVDGRDFLVWQRNTSVGDLADWQANYGGGMLTANSTAVPEPGGAILALAVAMYFVGRPRVTGF
jgi:T5SS/PEP-CTERM-associated repeat protein